MSSSGTTVEDVRDLFDTNESDTSVQTCIDMADDLVTQRLGDTTSELADGQYDRLVTLVSCHFLAAPDPTEESGSVGSESHDYEGISSTMAVDLLETRYGRRAVTYDPTGKLLDRAQEQQDDGGVGPDGFHVFGT